MLWNDRSRLWYHAQATIAGGGGRLRAGRGLGLRPGDRDHRVAGRGAALYPWLVASQAIPILAVAPIVAVWLDYGTAQVMVAFVVAFFPVVVTGVDGLRAWTPLWGGRPARSGPAGRGPSGA